MQPKTFSKLLAAGSLGALLSAEWFGAVSPSVVAHGAEPVMATFAAAPPPPPVQPPTSPPLSAQPPAVRSATPPRGLRIPPELPGASAEPLRLPPYNPNNPEQRLSTIEKLFPRMPQLPPVIQPLLGPSGQPLRLGELENMAIITSPVVQQAIFDIASARGKAIQDGTHPNPTIGYKGDTEIGRAHV